MRTSPTLLVLGESAGVIAALAISNNCAIQAVPINQVTNALVIKGIKISWP
jgi:hypothetical protein